MGICNLAHIPRRLHYNDLPKIPQFEIGEELYWRADNDKRQDDPPYVYFDPITRVVEISLNRSSLSQPNDVFFNCVDCDPPIYPNKHIVVFKVHSADTFPRVTFYDDKKLVIQLEHDTIDCNYAHSLFRMYLNDELIDYIAFEQKQLNDKKIGKKFRRSIKDELNKLIVSTSD